MKDQRQRRAMELFHQFQTGTTYLFGKHQIVESPLRG